MPCQTIYQAASMSPAPNARLAASVRGRIGKAWRAYWEWRAKRATIMLLQSLDTRTLRDIGINAGEIEWLVRCGSDRGRPYDSAWLWRCGGS